MYEPTYQDAGATPEESALIAYVLGYADEWRNYNRATYHRRWEEYDRYWRVLYHPDQRTRQTERSQLVTPGIADAVDSVVSEMVEATFGPDGWFDIQDTKAAGEQANPAAGVGVGEMRNEIRRRFDIDGVEGAIEEVIQLGEVYGDGFAELCQGQAEDRLATVQPDAQGNAVVGVQVVPRVAYKVRPLHPKSVLAAPHVRHLCDSPLVIVEEFVPLFGIQEKQRTGEYLEVPVHAEAPEQELLPVQEDLQHGGKQVRIHRAFGKIPRHLLEGKKEPEPGKPWEVVDAIVHIVNRRRVVLATETPFMSARMPIFHYRPAVITGRLHGRGTVERGAQMQRATDGTFRAYQDSLPYTAFPVFAGDATKLPRGFKFELYPGRNILMNGDPSGVMQRLDMGGPPQGLLENSKILSAMLTQATGTLDGNGISGAMQGVSNPQVLQVLLGGVVQKHKRRLLRLQSDFIAPLLREVGMRLMQFEPQRFPVKDYTWTPKGTLGMLAREFELMRLTTVMATLGPESPVLPLLMAKAIELSSLKDREQVAMFLTQQAQRMAADPERARAMQLKEFEFQLGLEKTRSEIALNNARASREMVAAQLEPRLVEAQVIAAYTKNLPESPEDKEFERRLKLADVYLKAHKIDTDAEAQASNERIASGKERPEPGESAQAERREAPEHDAKEAAPAAPMGLGPDLMEAISASLGDPNHPLLAALQE